MKPLIKWAGGKRQMLPSIMARIPDSWETYYEPFAGGLALFCELSDRGLLGESVISDVNGELINLYAVVKEAPEDLIVDVESYGFRNLESSYYDCRTRFNLIKGSPAHKVERAALFMYLNRHSYNGLWRVNRSGNFNVPFGRYSNPSLPEASHIKEFSRALADVRIELGDFTDIVSRATKKDFVYFDPPYLPVSDSSNFTGYTSSGFGMSDQERLADVCRKLNKNGVRFIISNSFTEKIREIYDGFDISQEPARRNINRNSSGRSGHHELLISNFGSGASQVH